MAYEPLVIRRRAAALCHMRIVTSVLDWVRCHTRPGSSTAIGCSWHELKVFVHILQVLVALFADACTQITEPAHQAILLDRVLASTSLDPDEGRLHSCLQTSTWFSEQAHQNLLAITNSWAAGGFMCCWGMLGDALSDMLQSHACKPFRLCMANCQAMQSLLLPFVP